MERRDFIKRGCLACGAFALAGVLPASLLQSCTTLPMLKTTNEGQNISISKSKLDATKNLFVLRNDELQYDVLLVKKPDGTYYAMYMQCTHNDNPVTANGSGLFCSMHGSVFDLEGKPTNGPANTPLKRYAVSEKEDNLIIHIAS